MALESRLLTAAAETGAGLAKFLALGCPGAAGVAAAAVDFAFVAVAGVRGRAWGVLEPGLLLGTDGD